MKYRRRHKLAHRGIVPSGLDRERLGNGGDPIAMIQNLAMVTVEVGDQIASRFVLLVAAIGPEQADRIFGRGLWAFDIRIRDL